MIRKKYNPYLILLLYVTALVLYHLTGYLGHFGYDDLHYARVAHDLTRGVIDYNDHFTYRFALVLPAALFYSFFGLSDPASALPALLASVAVLWVVFSLLKDKGTVALVTGLTLTAFSNWFIFYSGKLMPDMYVTLSVVLVLFFIYKLKYDPAGKPPFFYALLTSLAMLFGFLSKGNIVLILPLLAYLFVVDMFRRRDLVFWKYFILSGVVLLALYFFIIRLLTGDFLKRFEAIAQNSYLNLCSYDRQPARILLKRILYGFFSMSVYQALITPYIFIAAFLFRKNVVRYFRFDDPFSFFLTAAILLFLSSDFMTISATSYAPMCLDPRHYLFLIPVAAIPASQIIVRFREDKRYDLSLPGVLLPVTVISAFLPGHTFRDLYLPLSVLVILYMIFRKRKHAAGVFVVLFVAVMAIQPVRAVQWARRVKYRKQKEILYQYVLSRKNTVLVVTNEVQARLGDYYNGFGKNPDISFVTYEDFIPDSSDTRTKLLFLNWYTRYLSGMEEEDLPFYARKISPENKLLYENQKMHISVWEMKEFLGAGVTGGIRYSSLNGFENPVPYWHHNGAIDTAVVFAGSRANRLSGFSSSFEYPVDSLHLKQEEGCLVKCALYGNFPDKTKAVMVIWL